VTHMLRVHTTVVLGDFASVPDFGVFAVVAAFAFCVGDSSDIDLFGTLPDDYGQFAHVIVDFSTILGIPVVLT